MGTNEEAALKRSRTMYIIQAALEYLVAILVSGSYFATVTKELGISDSLTGILSSIISLGCLFQILSVSYRRKRVKNMVIILSIVNQVLFGMLYVIPIINLPSGAKTAMFVIFIISAYVFYNFAHPKKTAWLMSLVDDNKRGSFTANKEIISLLSGMAFSFGMGALIDYFKSRGEVRIAFIITALVILTLTVLHTVTLIFSIEKESRFDDNESGKGLRGIIKSFGEVLRDKGILKVTLLYVIYQIAHYASIPFFGTYMIGELAMPLTTVTVLTMLGSVSRILVSKFWGRYADKYSFASLIEKCFFFIAAAFICVIFATPKTGVIMFALYNILHGISMGGINSALTNMIFDYAPTEKRADALVVSQSAGGVIGFITTLIMSAAVSAIQANGNSFLGISLYAQQLASAISLICIIIATLYVRFVIIRRERECKRYSRGDFE